MAIINLYNKKLNVTYVYDSVSYWDKDLKQTALQKETYRQARSGYQ